MAESPWTEDRITQLSTLWATGISASLIGDEMKMTRNMVLGKVFRLGLPPREERKAAGENKQRRSPNPRMPRIRSSEPRDKSAAPRMKPELYIVSVADVTPLHINLMQLTALTCRYPYGEAAPYTFCGCEVQAGKPNEPSKPYCPAHVEICKGKPEPRRSSVKPIKSMGWGIKRNFRVFA